MSSFDKLFYDGEVPSMPKRTVKTDDKEEEKSSKSSVNPVDKKPDDLPEELPLQDSLVSDDGVDELISSTGFGRFGGIKRGKGDDKSRSRSNKSDGLMEVLDSLGEDSDAGGLSDVEGRDDGGLQGETGGNIQGGGTKSWEGVLASGWNVVDPVKDELELEVSSGDTPDVLDLSSEKKLLGSTEGNDSLLPAPLEMGSLESVSLPSIPGDGGGEEDLDVSGLGEGDVEEEEDDKGTIDEVLDEPINDLDAVLEGTLEIDVEGVDTGLDSYGDVDWSVTDGAFETYIDEDDEYAVAARDFNIDRIISHAIDSNASDIHIYPDDYIVFRILGEQVRQKQFGLVTPQLTDQLTDRVTGHREREHLVVNRRLDTSYVVKVGPYTGRRTRVAVGHNDGRRDFVFRIIADQIMTVEELGVPDELLEWSTLSRGLVMMNGPTGSGKSTTLASLVQNMLDSRPHHIITLERPIEYMFTPSKGTVVQRSVGDDILSFQEGLTAAMRSDPDIIMVGEVRNREEVDALLTATETGHLTISTMHTNNASGAVDRIVSMYDKEELRATMGVLASVSKGFANQLLVLSPDDKSRSAVREILPVNSEIRDLIEEGDSRGIYSYQWDKGITMEHELMKAVEQGATTLERARLQSNDFIAFEQLAEERKKFL